MGYHNMTPARRAALRKAQLASAAKRRKYGVGSQAKRAVKQQAGFAKASVQVAANRRHVGSSGFQKKTKKALKYATSPATKQYVGRVAKGAATGYVIKKAFQGNLAPAIVAMHVSNISAANRAANRKRKKKR
jgi:hypothetical protein